MDAREWRFCTALEGGREIEGGGDITDAILIGKFAANATPLRLFVGDCHHPLEAMLGRGRKRTFYPPKRGAQFLLFDTKTNTTN